MHVKLPYFADQKNLEVEPDEPKTVQEGPRGNTSLELLQTVYRDRSQPLNVRVRCAVEALAHEYPRVSAVAVTSMSGQSFAEALERAIERSTKPPPKVIEHEPPEIPAEDLKGPFPNYRDNYRRY
jgi:hypothetical protein